MAEAQVESAVSDLLVCPLLEGHRLVEGGIALNRPKDQLVHPLLQGHRLSLLRLSGLTLFFPKNIIL